MTLAMKKIFQLNWVKYCFKTRIKEEGDWLKGNDSGPSPDSCCTVD